MIKNRFFFFCCLYITGFIQSGVLSGQINTPSGATVPFATNQNYGSRVMMPTNLPSSGQYGASQQAAEAYNWWKSVYIRQCPGSPKMYRVRYEQPPDSTLTVSEGIGYGMLLAAYAADKDLFDGLYQYYMKFVKTNGLMGWKIKDCSSVQDQGSAADADLDITLALLIAAKQWAASAIDYNAQAKKAITGIKNSEIVPNTNEINNGDGWGFGNTCRNPGYQAPAYYKVFGKINTSESGTWTAAVSGSYSLIKKNRHQTTGLISNWCDNNGNHNGCNGPDEYGYDACRNPWRMAVSLAWFAEQNDSIAKNICQKVSTYINSIVTSQGMSKLAGPVKQDGSLTGTLNSDCWHNAVFVSTWSIALMGADVTYQSLLNSMYSETVKIKDPVNMYFGNTLRTIMLFLMTGNFWNPTDPLVGNTDQGIQGHIDVYPVPFSDILNIRMDYFTGNKVKIKLFDITGKILLNNDYPFSGGLLTVHFTSGFKNGYYLLEVTTENAMIYKQRMIKL